MVLATLERLSPCCVCPLHSYKGSRPVDTGKAVGWGRRMGQSPTRTGPEEKSYVAVLPSSVDGLHCSHRRSVRQEGSAAATCRSRTRCRVHGPRGAGRYRRLAGLHRTRRKRQELQLGGSVRDRHRLQGQRKDRRHFRRDGVADDAGRVRPGHRIGRCIVAVDTRRHGAARRRRQGSRLRHHRSAPERCALACRRRQALRRAVSVGTERPALQQQGVQDGADIVERGIRSRRNCRTANRTRAASRHTTARSTLPTLRCIS